MTMITVFSAMQAAFTVVAMAFAMGCAQRDESARPGDVGATRAATSIPRSSDMTENKRTVEKYVEGFRQSDHEQVLSCLTDDVEWEIPGVFHVTGKGAFDKQIENDAFVGSPAITITRMTEENDVVVAEGSVRSQRKAGGFLTAKFCDVFVMQGGKIKQLISYVMEIK